MDVSKHFFLKDTGPYEILICCSDTRIFEIASGKGFREFVQTHLDLGQGPKYRLIVDSMLPAPTTYGPNIGNIADYLCTKLKVITKDHFKTEL